MIEWQETLNIILTGIIIPAIPLLGAWLRAWFKERAEYARAKNEREYFNYHLDKVEELIYTMVMDVEGVYVSLLEDDGLFDKEAQTTALNMAKDKIMAQLTVQAKEVLEKTYVDYNAFIESKIEEIVESM